jgi:plasmid stabilization system protein ParE
MPDRVIVFASDLLDRSRIDAALGTDHNVEFERDPAGVSAGGTIRSVVVDLAKFAECLTSLREALGPAVRIVAYGPHVDDALLHGATSAGATEVFPRSRFFRDVRNAALGPLTDR